MRTRREEPPPAGRRRDASRDTERPPRHGNVAHASHLSRTSSETPTETSGPAPETTTSPPIQSHASIPPTCLVLPLARARAARARRHDRCTPGGRAAREERG